MNHDLGAVVARGRHDLQEVPGPVPAEVENFASVVLVGDDDLILNPAANVLVANLVLASRL